MRIVIEGHDLPGARFVSDGAPLQNVHVAVQIGKEPVGLVPGDADGARWEVDVLRRAKLMIEDIEPALLDAAARDDGVLVASLSLTDERGCPRCARVKPPVISWRSG